MIDKRLLGSSHHAELRLSSWFKGVNCERSFPRPQEKCAPEGMLGDLKEHPLIWGGEGTAPWPCAMVSGVYFSNIPAGRWGA